MHTFACAFTCAPTPVLPLDAAEAHRTRDKHNAKPNAKTAVLRPIEIMLLPFPCPGAVWFQASVVSEPMKAGIRPRCMVPFSASDATQLPSPPRRAELLNRNIKVVFAAYPRNVGLHFAFACIRRIGRTRGDFVAVAPPV